MSAMNCLSCLKLSFSLLLLLAGLTAAGSCGYRTSPQSLQKAFAPADQDSDDELQQAPHSQKSSAYNRDTTLSQLLDGQTKRIKPGVAKPVGWPKVSCTAADLIAQHRAGFCQVSSARPSLSTLHVRLQI